VLRVKCWTCKSELTIDYSNRRDVGLNGRKAQANIVEFGKDLHFGIEDVLYCPYDITQLNDEQNAPSDRS